MSVLENLLKSEIAAMDTYDQALQEVDESPQIRILHDLRRDHEFAAYALRVLLARFSDQGDLDDPELWPLPGGAVRIAGRIRDGVRIVARTTALAALKLGEESGVFGYLQALETPMLADEARFVIERQILPRCRDHIGTLESMLDAA